MPNKTPTTQTPTPSAADPILDDPADYSNANLTVSGEPVPGNIVELEYDSNSGGAFFSQGTTSIRGELLYVEHDSSLDSIRFVVRDPEQSRAVAFSLKPDSVAQPTIKSLAARKTRFGRDIGDVVSVRFTDESSDTFAPVITALRAVTSGDTLWVNGEEYGVLDAHSSGPTNRPYRYRATLTKPDGTNYILEANPSYEDAPTFAEHGGSDLDLNPEQVEVGRLRERWDDRVRDDVNAQQRTDTTDMFPAPHGAREGDALAFTIEYEDGSTEHLDGIVTSVRYFPKEESGIGGIEEKDPETRLDLDDGREAVLSNRRGSVHGMIIESTDGDGTDEYHHGTVTLEQ